MNPPENTKSLVKRSICDHFTSNSLEICPILQENSKHFTALFRSRAKTPKKVGRVEYSSLSQA